jgi:hypothetical protein
MGRGASSSIVIGSVEKRERAMKGIEEDERDGCP